MSSNNSKLIMSTNMDIATEEELENAINLNISMRIPIKNHSYNMVTYSQNDYDIGSLDFENLDDIVKEFNSFLKLLGFDNKELVVKSKESKEIENSKEIKKEKETYDNDKEYPEFSLSEALKITWFRNAYYEHKTTMQLIAKIFNANYHEYFCKDEDSTRFDNFLDNFGYLIDAIVYDLMDKAKVSREGFAGDYYYNKISDCLEKEYKHIIDKYDEIDKSLKCHKQDDVVKVHKYGVWTEFHTQYFKLKF